MVSISSSTPHNAANGRTDHGGPGHKKAEKSIMSSAQKNQSSAGGKSSHDVAGLQDYQLGDCVGRGAFGSVYRALNWGTGETVAVKQVKLADLPKSELRVIMLEIDLLKNLNHANIVKYHGFVKSSESLYIILEYCENGSLHSICKNFGKFPENLVALYMSQVLHGLLYLHEQGVIHRDIKGANILTTKEGLVKLADFGVATKATGLHESSVVGTPYWMAPEVIELSGATTASDIWSLGCTVIELIDGKPPYHKLPPMPALFRIVNDDHPPLPESASPAVQDFLMQCFQKDPNLRVSAKKLLKHPWIVSARRIDAVVPVPPTKYDEAVKSVQQWNEALKSPKNDSAARDLRQNSASPTPLRLEPSTKLTTSEIAPTRASLEIPKQRQSKKDEVETWDDDFASSISPSAFKAPHLKPVDNFAGMLSPENLKAYASIEVVAEEDGFESKYDGNATVKSPLEYPRPDPQETVRTLSPQKTRSRASKPNQGRPIKDRFERLPSQPKTQILRSTPAPSKRRTPSQSSQLSIKDGKMVEDYSDLVDYDEVTWDRKLAQLRAFQQDEQFSPKLFHPSDLKDPPRSSKSSKMGGSLRGNHITSGEDEAASVRRTRSSIEIQKYAEDEGNKDYSDIYGYKDLAPDSESGSEPSILNMVNSKFSTNSWLDEEDEEDDPFAQLEENLDEMDMATKVARDKHVRMCTLVESLVGSLKISQLDDILEDVSEQLMQVLFESPAMKTVIISSHGLLPILEVLDNCSRRDVSLRLLKIINTIILDSQEIQETLCFVGGIPIITKFASKKFSSEIRLEAAAFVRQMYQTSTLTLQMFISCGGLHVLVEFLEEDYEAERDLVLIGVNGVWSVFDLQGPTPKNDFCRIFSRSSVLYPLSLVLNRVLDETGEVAELVQSRIVNIFYLFSQAENHVKESVADRMVLKRVLKDLRRMSPEPQITMLKFIKNLSMLATTLDPLHHSNAIEVLTDLLSCSTKMPLSRDISNQVLHIMFNLCRLNKTRQEDAALNGIIPLLQKTVQTEMPLKQFALPVLCDMAHSGTVTRKILWQNKGLDFYVSLLTDENWQVTALDAIFVWLQEETAKVEAHLLSGTFPSHMIACFISANSGPFESLLEPLQKLLRLSPPLAATLAHPDLFTRTLFKLRTKKAVVRGNLLRIIRSICDASVIDAEHSGTGVTHNPIEEYGLYDTISRLATSDPAILVRNMAADLLKSSEAAAAAASHHGRHRSNVGIGESGSARYKRPPGLRRTSSSNMTPSSLFSSQPPTPQHLRSPLPHGQQADYFDIGHESVTAARGAHPRGNSHVITPTGITSNYRPSSRDSSSSANVPTSSSGSSSSHTATTAAVKSRLPRTSAARLTRSSVASLARRDELNGTPTGPTAVPLTNGTGAVAYNAGSNARAVRALAEGRRRK